ncbi:hypothetical protein MLD38_035262 [Melastoma candidum]|uniref:Uncharacterized protein n=1 Tax=Melastoma candidum TaxID=119954 RepID=A0ACB9MCQ6_9MYRT|nr:hypothetical protein MLD38_035262 [Melastoma candidum]
MTEAPSANADYYSANEAEDNNDGCNEERRKNKGSSVGRVDEALEDTASSPINTPKLTEDEGINRGKRAVVGRGGGGGGGDSRLLKERGLCLVPLSMAVNYLG